MAEEVEVSLSNLTPSDMQAVVAYLRSIPVVHARDLPSVKMDPAAQAPNQMQSAADAVGREIFEGACASCHEWTGVSPLTTYATLTGSRAVNDPSGMNVVQIVLSGESTRTAEGLAMMPAFADAYSDTEIAAVANYVTARFGAVPSHLAAQDVVPLRQSQYLSVPDRNEKHP
jgi:mono/diheme cytochrome c family protein